MDVIDLHNVSCLVVSLLLRSRAVNVIVSDRISDELWRSDWSHLNLRYLVSRIERVVLMTSGFEFDTVWL